MSRSLLFKLLVAFVFASSIPAHAQGNTATAAGTVWNFTSNFSPTPFASGSGPAASAPLSLVRGIATDTFGNFFVADSRNNLVLKVTSAGVLTIVAGNPISNSGSTFSGDGGLATNAVLNFPTGVAVDSSGNIFIADSSSNRIRKVDAISGIITTIAGTGTASFSGDGGPAISATLSFPVGLRVDGSGSIYVADSNNHRIRKFTPGGNITTVAGTGTAGFGGDSGQATLAQLNFPQDVAIDNAGTAFYIADQSNNRIRKVDIASGVISTVAGTGTLGSTGDGGQATLALLNFPRGVTFDASGNLYIGDSNNNRVRKVTSGGVISTVAGSGTFSFLGDGGVATSAALRTPLAVAVDTAGTLLIADNNNYRVRGVTGTTINTLAGNGLYRFAGDGGLATSAFLALPQSVVVDSTGNTYVAEVDRNRVRKINSGGVVSTLAGSGYSGSSGDNGLASNALLSIPRGVAVDLSGNVYIADTNNNRIRKVTISTGNITAFAGTGTSGFLGDGAAATASRLNAPRGMVVDLAGNVYIADTGNNRIRKVDVGSGFISTIAGTGTASFSGDGGPANVAALSAPNAVTLDTAGNLYIADRDNARIRKIDTLGNISTVAGNGTQSSTGDGGLATSAAINRPESVLVDSAGNIYIAEASGNRIRKVLPNGIIYTIAGNGTFIFNGESGPALSINLGNPRGLAFDTSGNLLIADQFNDRVRRMTTSLVSYQVTPSPVNFTEISGATATQTVTIGNVTVNTLGWTAGYSTTSGGNWLSGTASGTAPGTFTVTANALGLPPGSYQGNILLQTPLADAVNQNITVNLTVLAAPVTPGPAVTALSGGYTFQFPTNGQSLSAPLGVLNQVAVDAAGNVFTADSSNNIIVKITPAGAISIVAGTGISGFTGDGGLATNARISAPLGVALDGSGNLYISDTNNNRVRKVDTSGIITTIAGNGIAGFSGDGGLAINASLNSPRGLLVDGSGNIYVADTSNNRVRKFTVGGNISTIAGTGGTTFAGDNGPAVNATLNGPLSVALDSLGNLFISVSARIRKVDTLGIITTIVGNATNTYSGDGGLATAAQVNAPRGMAFDLGGNMYIADVSNHRIRKIDTSGIISTVAGAGFQGYTGDGGPASTATLNSPGGIAVDSGGNLYIGDTSNFRIRKVANSGTFGSFGNISTIAGNGLFSYRGDGSLAVGGVMNAPSGSAFDAAGNLYISDVNAHVVRKIDTSGIITTYAGSALIGFAGDTGPATSAKLNSPRGLAVDSGGNLYIADVNNSRIRKVAPGGTITTFAGIFVPGSVSAGFSGDGGQAALANLNLPRGVAIGPSGTILIADTGNHRIRKVDAAGVITTIAGTGTASFSGDGGLGTLATLNTPDGLAVDAAGNVFIADTNNHRIRKVDTSGNISTVAGNGTLGYFGDGGPAIAAELNAPQAVAVDAAGNLYIADSGNFRLRKVDVAGTITTLSGNGVVSTAGDGGLAGTATYISLIGVTVDAAGNNVYVSTSNHIRKVSLGPNTFSAPSTINFTVTTNGYATQAFSLTSAMTGLVWSAFYNAGAGTWLSGDTTLTSPTLIPVTVDATGLAPGSYQGTVTVQVPSTVTPAQIVTVNLTVLPAPTLPGPVINTVAGKDFDFAVPPGGVATNANMGTARGVALDSSGNVYASDGSNHMVFKITPAGVLSIVAGTGIFGFSGDGGPGPGAELNAPRGIAVDSSGNIFISDTSNNRIRKVNAAGTISTIAGTGAAGFGGDGGLAVNALLNNPREIALDSAGNLFIADGTNNRIRKISPGGIISTVAGTGVNSFTGDGGLATGATLSGPSGVVLDSSGNLYIADTGNNRIRAVNLAGIITTVVGNGISGYSGDGGPSTLASLNAPNGISIDSAGNGYITDNGNHVIRKVSSGTGIISTAAGNGNAGFTGDGGLAAGAQLDLPLAVVSNTAGNLLYIADQSNRRIRKVDAGGNITTFAGNGIWGYSGDGGQATLANLNSPNRATIDGSGNIFVVDGGNQLIRKVSPSGVITTVAGTGTAAISPDGGAATSTALFNPAGIVVDGGGNIFFADRSSHRIRKIDTLGTVTTIAGNTTAGFSGDGGLAVNAQLNNPRDLAFDLFGNLLIVDNLNHRIRKVTPGGIITTIAGTGTATFSGDGGLALNASLNGPFGMSLDTAGNIFVADTSNNRIRKIDPAGIITTVAGNGTIGFDQDGIAAIGAALFNPTFVLPDASGNLYITDNVNSRIRKVNSAGTISAFAGTGIFGFAGDGGLASQAQLANPQGLTRDAAGNIYIADLFNGRVRKVLLAGTGGQAASVSVQSGNNQSAFIGQSLPAPVVALVTDFNGNPVAGVTVAFAVSTGGGSLFNIQAVTNAQGQASANWTMGGSIGINTLTATVARLAGSPVTITATGTGSTNPAVTVEQAAGQTDPTSVSPINFTATFSEAVTGLLNSDVQLGGTAGATSALVTGGPTVYNIAVSGMTASGTVTASIPAGVTTGTVSLLPNLDSTSADNSVNFVVFAPVTVTSKKAAGQADPASAQPINFTVTFSETVTGFSNAGLLISGTAPGTKTGIVTGSGATYNVAVSGMTGSGTVVLAIKAGAATGTVSGNANSASTNVDNFVTYTVPPKKVRGQVTSF